MYRIGFLFVMVLAITLGVVAGVLNPQIITVDLLWVQLAWPLGMTLICVLVLGILLGFLLIALFTVWPLRIRLRRAEKQVNSKTFAATNLMENQDD